MFAFNKANCHKLLEVFGLIVLTTAIFHCILGLLYVTGLLSEANIASLIAPIQWPYYLQVFRQICLIGIGAIYNTWLHFFPQGDMFCILVLAPIFEELQFRLPLLYIKNKKLQIALALISSIIFGLCHPYGIIGNFQTFIVGCFLSYIAIKTKSVKYSMALHALVNFLAVVR